MLGLADFINMGTGVFAGFLSTSPLHAKHLQVFTASELRLLLTCVERKSLTSLSVDRVYIQSAERRL